MIVKSSQALSPALLRTRCDVTGLGSCLLLLVAMLVIAGVVLLTLPAPELQSQVELETNLREFHKVSLVSHLRLNAKSSISVVKPQ